MWASLVLQVLHDESETTCHFLLLQKPDQSTCWRGREWRGSRIHSSWCDSQEPNSQSGCPKRAHTDSHEFDKHYRVRFLLKSASSRCNCLTGNRHKQELADQSCTFFAPAVLHFYWMASQHVWKFKIWTACFFVFAAFKCSWYSKGTKCVHPYNLLSSCASFHKECDKFCRQMIMQWTTRDAGMPTANLGTQVNSVCALTQTVALAFCSPNDH